MPTLPVNPFPLKQSRKRVSFFLYERGKTLSPSIGNTIFRMLKERNGFDKRQSRKRGAALVGPQQESWPMPD
jgi:hypothetical protein